MNKLKMFDFEQSDDNINSPVKTSNIFNTYSDGQDNTKNNAIINQDNKTEDKQQCNGSSLEYASYILYVVYQKAVV